MARIAVLTENTMQRTVSLSDETHETPGLGFLLREAYRAFSRELTIQLERHGITHAQWVFLWFLYQRESLSPMEFAKLANIKKSSVTSVLNAIQVQGLVTTKRGDSDARQVIVKLTPHGRSTVKKLFKCAIEANNSLTSTLSGAEVNQLMRLLGKVVNSLNDG